VSVVGIAAVVKPKSTLKNVLVLPMPQIVKHGASPHPFRETAEFEVEPSEGWTAVEWKFGDESESSKEPKPTHKYKTRGSFQVQAELTWPDGQKLPLTETVNVVAEPPVPKPEVQVEGKPVESVLSGTTVRLTHESEGDVAVVRWKHDDKLVGGDEPTLLLVEPGEQRFVLELDGPPDRKGEVETKSKEVSVTVSPAVIKIVSGQPAKFRDPVQFQLETRERCKTIEWDFGDGQSDKENNVSPTHKYGIRGSVTVTAIATWEGHDPVKVSETFDIEAEPPQADLPDVQGPVTTGTAVSLEHTSKGDVVKATYYHNNQRLPDDKGSVVIENRGKHVIRVDVEGPPDKEGKRLTDRKQIEFLAVWKLPLAVLLIAAAICLGLFLLAWRCLMGNQLRAWRIYYRLGEKPDLNTGTSKPLKRKWRWCAKVAKFTMKSLFPQVSCYQTKTLGAATVEVRRSKRGKRVGAKLTYSRQRHRNPNVEDIATSDPDDTTVTRAWRDKDCTDEKGREFYITLERKESKEFWPRLSLALIGLVIVACLVCVSQLVFRGI
jgi:PKD repeat protein